MLVAIVTVIATIALKLCLGIEYDPPETYVPRPKEYTGDFKVLQQEFKQPLDGVTRKYYVAIEELVWDYTATSEDISETNAAYFWTHSSPTTIGNRYYKAVYCEYTDDSFMERQLRPRWQGLMGPILRAEVGDTFQVHLWNRASHDFSMHPHGVFYEFDMEGAVYKGAAEPVRPGENYTYVWQVPPRAGPGPNDGHSLVWGYHSHVTENDIFAGLFGSIIVYRRGELTKEAIANERVTALFAINENLSPYMSKTMEQLAIHVDQEEIHKNQHTIRRFKQSNIKQTINGFMLGRPKDMTLPANKTTTWHLLGWGSYNDVQLISWENAEVTLFDTPISQIRLMPATFKTVKVVPEEPGVGRFGYLKGKQGLHGMSMYYTVH